MTAGSDPTPVRAPREIVSSVVLATAIFLLTEVMLFAGLLSAYIVLRGQAAGWPPADQPRLPVLATAFSTALLLASGVSMWHAVDAHAVTGWSRSRGLLGATWALGAGFLAVQGSEWASLLGHGLTTTSSVYGALFYTIVGCHGLHVVAALVVLAVVLGRAARRCYDAGRVDGLHAARLYWTFVVAVWPPIYGLVYLW